MSFVGAGIAIAGVAGAGAAIYGANQQSSAESQALGLQQQQQNYLRGQSAPYINAGTGAVNLLSQLTGAGGTNPNYSSFYNSPDYLFAQQQGNAALQNYLNANGISLSGAGITAAINYNQGLATQQYGNYYNRLMQIAQLGSNTLTGTAGPSASIANASANTLGAIGASNASGVVGAANALGGATNNALLYNAISRGQVNPSSYAVPNAVLPGGAPLGQGGIGSA